MLTCINTIFLDLLISQHSVETSYCIYTQRRKRKRRNLSCIVMPHVNFSGSNNNERNQNQSTHTHIHKPTVKQWWCLRLCSIVNWIIVSTVSSRYPSLSAEGWRCFHRLAVGVYEQWKDSISLFPSCFMENTELHGFYMNGLSISAYWLLLTCMDTHWFVCLKSPEW